MSEPPHEFEEEPAVFVDEDEADIQRALADFEAGRVISNDAVMRWLRSLDTDSPLPRPRCGE